MGCISESGDHVTADRKDRLWESFPCDRGRMWEKHQYPGKKVRKNAGEKEDTVRGKVLW